MQIHLLSVDLHVHLNRKDYVTDRRRDPQACDRSFADLFSWPYHFFSRPEDAHLAKANMERRALQRAVGLPHYNDVNTAGQGGRVEASVQLLDLDKHLACQLAHVVHGLTCLVEQKVKVVQ